MGDIRLRKWLVSWFRTRVKRQVRSNEAEFNETPEEAAVRRKKAITAELRGDLRELKAKQGLFSDSAEIIREMRETRS